MLGFFFALLFALLLPLLAFLLAGLGLLLALAGFLFAFAFTLFSLLFALALPLLGHLFALFGFVFSSLLLSLFGVLLGLLGGFVGGLGRIFTPLVAEVTLFFFVLLGLFDGVLLGNLLDAGEFALIFLLLLDAVVDFLLALALGLFTGFGLALELLEVLFLGALLSLDFLIGKGALL